MQHISLFFALLFCLPTAYAQVGSRIDGGLTNRGLTPLSMEERMKNIEGTRFLREDFTAVKIEGQSQAMPGHYDAYHEKILVKKEDKLMLLDTRYGYRATFEDNGAVYVTTTYPDGKGGFARLLFENDAVKLLRREYVSILPPVESNGYQPAKPERFSNVKTDLYIHKAGKNVAQEVPRKKKDILRTLFDDEKRAKKLSKEHRLNPKKEEDLVKLFALYYNQD